MATSSLPDLFLTSGILTQKLFYFTRKNLFDEVLGNALNRLEAALHESHKNPLYLDATIQRFEFVIELFWKTLKRFLELEGIQASTPRDVLKKAYAAKWLQSEIIWLEMMQDRNETSRVYDEKKALEIYQHIQKNFPELKKTYIFLVEKGKIL